MAAIPDYVSKLAENWSYPYVARSQIGEFTNGLYSSSYMAKLDSRGLGPRRVTLGRKEETKTGGKVIYPMPDFLKWLASRIVEDTGKDE